MGSISYIGDLQGLAHQEIKESLFLPKLFLPQLIRTFLMSIFLRRNSKSTHHNGFIRFFLN